MTDKDVKKLTELVEQDLSEAFERMPDASTDFANMRPRKDRQLNLRVDADMLDGLRKAASIAGESYHSLARSYIEQGIARELARAAESPTTADRRFTTKEAALVLLYANSGEEEVISGRTRLQKLLFLLTQHLQPRIAARFEAYDFGPFDEYVSQDIEFLASEGLISLSGHTDRERWPQREHRGEQLLNWVQVRGETPGSPVEEYRLTGRGLEWVRRFLGSEAFGSKEDKNRLLDESKLLIGQFGRVPLSELVDYVYAQYPAFTTRSKIRDQVESRRARKHDAGFR